MLLHFSSGKVIVIKKYFNNPPNMDYKFKFIHLIFFPRELLWDWLPVGVIRFQPFDKTAGFSAWYCKLVVCLTILF